LRQLRCQAHGEEWPMETLQVSEDTCPIIKIKDVFVSIASIKATAVANGVIVQGTLDDEVLFVDATGVVRERRQTIPFQHFFSIPGVKPDTPVEVEAEVEFVLFHLTPDRCAIVQKIVLKITVRGELEEDPVFDRFELLENQGFEKTEQVLIVITKEFIRVKKERIRVGEIREVKEQVLVVARTPLDAIKIKRIDAKVVDVQAVLLIDMLMVTGVIEKTIAFVGPDNIVRVVKEQIPFTHSLSFPGITPQDPVQVTVDIEFIIPELNVAEHVLTQKIVLLVRAVVVTPTQEVVVMTDISGPGITQVDKVQIRVDTEVISVVTDVKGPGVTDVQKTTIFVDVVNDSNPFPVPLQVVTAVTVNGQFIDP